MHLWCCALLGREAVAVNVLAYPWDDLECKAPELAVGRVRWRKNVAVHAVDDRKFGEFIDPLVDGTVEGP